MSPRNSSTSSRGVTTLGDFRDVTLGVGHALSGAHGPASSGREEIDLVVLLLLRLLRFGRRCVRSCNNFGVLAIFIGINRDSPWCSTSCYGLEPCAKTMLDLHAVYKARKLQNL